MGGETEWAAMRRIAELLVVGSAETVRKWVRQEQVDAGARPKRHDRGGGRDQAPEAVTCRAAPRELDPEGSLGSLRGRARPALEVIAYFIREHADHRDPGGLRWGFDPICAVLSEHGLPFAPSTYYEHLGNGLAARQRRDEYLLGHIRRVHADNYGVYGARKV